MGSSVGCLRGAIFILSDAEESLCSRFIDHFRAFLFSCAFENRVLTFIRGKCFSVCGEYGFETSIHFFVDRWFHANEWKAFYRLQVVLETWLHSFYSSKGVPSHTEKLELGC